MGREVRRVPLDFDWPLDKTWDGFLMPEALCEAQCEACGGNGVTAAHRWVERIAHRLLMLDDDLEAQERGRPLHPWLQSLGYSDDPRPSADIRELGTGLAGREGGGFMGHDAIDRWRATAKIIEAAGLDPDVWGLCPACGGHGAVEKYPGQRADAEAWSRTDPPEGDGWQLWQTVSEGSPISPVFASPEGLAEWMASPAYTWGGPMDYDVALRFVQSGWAPSFVASAAGVQSGAEWVGSQ